MDTKHSAPSLVGARERSSPVTCELPAGTAASAIERPVAEATSLPLSAPAERFDDQGEIARGGMGSVRRVFDRVLHREVAMKVSDPSQPHYAETALRFVEEAQITGQLDHPNIVPVYDLGAAPEGPTVYFTMKLVDGQTLTEFFDGIQAQPYSHQAIERALFVFLKICEAVSFAHSRGVVHRDLKPDNVMVGSHGQVYVMDWGVAHLLGGERLIARPKTQLSRGDEPGTIVGTFDYMAPEQAWGRTAELDERTDVFGLGGILYALLTGFGPNAAVSAFDALQRAQRGNPDPPDRHGVWPELPPGLCQIAMKALSKDRKERYQTVMDLRSDVEEFLRGGGWFRTRTYAPGEVIVSQGEAADKAYIIVKGTCEVSKTVAGERTVLRTLGPDEVFGETAVLTGGVRTATVAARDEVTVKIVTRDALERELGRQSWGSAFVKALAERFRDVDEQLSALRQELVRKE